MPDEFITIDVKNLEKLIQALNKFPRQAARYLDGAGKEAASRVILPTEGLKKYPRATAANRPPYPYYIRGRGTQTSPRHNTMTSERLGTHWYVKTSKDNYSTIIGNPVSYAKYVVGDQQAHFMTPKGWRKLREVVEEKISDITKVYDAWIDKLLKGVGLG